MSMIEKKLKIDVIEHITKHSQHDIVIPEVTVGHKSTSSSYARADIFAINGEITIYEIKSKKDTLKRLSNQLKTYINYANRVYIVIDEKFINKLSIDDKIGIYIIKNNKFILYKEATYMSIKKEFLLQYWLSNELKDFLHGYKGTSKFNKETCMKYLDSLLSDKQLYHATLYMLKNRYKIESDYIKKHKQLLSRGMKKNSYLTPLKKLPFEVLMP